MAWNVLTPPLTLTQGKTYACALHLNFIEKAGATEDVIAERFEGVGFTGVTVDMSAGPRVEGQWGGATTGSVDLPSQVETVWEWSQDPTS